MKCDELETEQWLDYGGEPMPCYPAKDVDEAIAELKAENERLVKCCKEYDSGLRINEQIRATKRALWMARKAHAVAMVAYLDSHYRDNPNAVYRNRTVDWLRNRWLLILDAIIEKEKEYK